MSTMNGDGATSGAEEQRRRSGGEAERRGGEEERRGGEEERTRGGEDEKSR